ncbi:MAG: dynamin family protein [Pirellulales bacterium]|nr:dynamin family protein [Pirellulales bacterium]
MPLQEQLDLAQWDAQLADWRAWQAGVPPWQPIRDLRPLWQRLEPRLRELGETLDRVLVVGVLGGTGTGKSTLVNALVGETVTTASDKERPTTRQPIVIHHPRSDPAFLPLADWDARLVARPLPFLENLILIDCPDPDTQPRHLHPGLLNEGHLSANPPETAAQETVTNVNRDVLQKILPVCDVLICLGTAQKYKTLAVYEELRRFAPGRAIIFIQTHAAYDPDIRADWQRVLEGAGLTVAKILRLDSQAALDQHQQRLPQPAEFSELRAILEGELSARGRERIRRTNALDLWCQYAQRATHTWNIAWASVTPVQQAIGEEATRLTQLAQNQLRQRLLAERSAWRTRLLGDVAARWGAGPFGVFLRLTSNLWSWLRWAPFLRARGLGGLVVAGGLSAGQALSAALRTPDLTLTNLDAAELGWGAGELAQTESIVRGLATEARLPIAENAPLPSAARDAQRTARLEQLVHKTEANLASSIDRQVGLRVARQTSWAWQFLFEALFLSLPAALLARVGHNFFYHYLWLGGEPASLEVLAQGALWVLLWGWLWRTVLGQLVLVGWQRDAQSALNEFTPRSAVDTLFGDLQTEIDGLAKQRQNLEALTARLQAWRKELAPPEADGSLSRLRAELL